LCPALYRASTSCLAKKEDVDGRGKPGHDVEISGSTSRADNLAQARHDLAIANRVVSYEGIIDAFGHVSMRHPTKPDRYLISRSRSPEVVEASDIYEYTLDSEPVTPLPDGIRGYGELVIH